MRPATQAFAFIAFLPLVFGELSAKAGETKGRCPMDREYFLYTPASIDPARTYWLVVGVHGRGGNGKGACQMADLVRKGNCIVVGPSFPEGHKVLKNESDTQLIGLFKMLSGKYKLHEKLFITGFSAGGQFSHRFALKYPDLIIGAAPHSAGTWATGGDGGGVEVNEAAAMKVLFAMSCGEKDLATATRDQYTPEKLLPRLEWAHQFETVLKQHKFYFKARYWPGVKHSLCPAAKALTEECFDLATTGLHIAEREDMEPLFLAIETAIAAKDRAQARVLIGRLPADYAARRAKWCASSQDPAAAAAWNTNDAVKKELLRRAEAYMTERAAEYSARIASR